MKSSFKFLATFLLLVSAVFLNPLQAKTLSGFPNEFIGKWTGEYTSSGSINIQDKRIIQGDAREPNYCSPVNITQISPFEITVVCKMRTSLNGKFQKNTVQLFIKRIGNQLSYNFTKLPSNWTVPLSRD